MKYLFLGDIHGRDCWKEIIEKEMPDKTVFLGDYISTHEGISSEQQIFNLQEILNCKSLENIILLRGNHDNQHLGYYWAECSGYDRKVSSWMYEHRDMFLDNTQWLYHIPDTNIICSHAGISQVWIDESIMPTIGAQYDDGSVDMEQLFEHINRMEPSEKFGFIADNWYDNYGISKTQSLTWIRPQALCDYAIKGFTQIIGHTPTDKISSFKTVNEDTVWMCDCLENKHYLIFENGEFRTGFIKA